MRKFCDGSRVTEWRSKAPASARWISSVPSHAATRVHAAMWTSWSSFDSPVGLFHFFRLQRRLEAILGRPVDLVMKDAIKRQMRTRIMAEAVSAT